MTPKLEQIKKTTKETADELSKAAKAHVELAKNQYKEYTTRHGDPVEKLGNAVREPVEKTRARVVEVSKKAEKRAGDLAHKVNERTATLTKKLPGHKEEPASSTARAPADAPKASAQKAAGPKATSPKTDKAGPSNEKV